MQTTLSLPRQRTTQRTIPFIAMNQHAEDYQVPPLDPDGDNPTKMLISGVVVDLDDQGIPQMPAHLREFDARTVGGRSELARSEAAAAYTYWSEEQQWKNIRLRTSAASLPACHNDPLNVFTSQFHDPEPMVDEFGEDLTGERAAEASRIYWVRHAIANIRDAIAKSQCDQCPIRVACLAASLTHPRTREPNRIVAEDGDEIWGGWGPGARVVIAAAFRELHLADERDGSYRRWAVA